MCFYCKNARTDVAHFKPLANTHTLDPKWPLTAASLLIHCEESSALLVGELIVTDITAILSPYIVLWHRDHDKRRAPYVRWRCSAHRHHGGIRMFTALRPTRKHLLRKCNPMPAVNSCWGYGMWWLGESCHPLYFQTLYSKYVLSRRGRIRWGDSSLSADLERPQLPFWDGLMEYLHSVRTEHTLLWRLWDMILNSCPCVSSPNQSQWSAFLPSFHL